VLIVEKASGPRSDDGVFDGIGALVEEADRLAVDSASCHPRSATSIS
jgi:hypothetical protein